MENREMPKNEQLLILATEDMAFLENKKALLPRLINRTAERVSELQEQINQMAIPKWHESTKDTTDRPFDIGQVKQADISRACPELSKKYK